MTSRNAAADAADPVLGGTKAPAGAPINARAGRPASAGHPDRPAGGYAAAGPGTVAP